MTDDTFYWCRKHQRVEHSEHCGAAHILGPFPTAEAARDHQVVIEARNEAWDEADDQWDRWGKDR